MRKKSMWVVLAASLLLVGCSQPTTPEPTKTPPPQTKPDGNTGGQNGGNDPAKPPQDNPEPAEKSEAQVKEEISEKLARMTQPKGYLLELKSDGTVVGAEDLDEVAEQLRKKGYAIDIAKELARSFYKESGTGVKVVATEGWPGVFDPSKEATWTKKNKWTWIIEQKHTESGLYDPHLAHYEVEMLKDGTYRLNVWKTTNL